MRTAITGSIATDHLMVFPGRFTDHLVADQLQNVSLSFLADTLEVRRGGVAANIAFGMGQLGLAPVLVGAVGPDFADYQVWLKQHGVDTDSVQISHEHQTARFVCTTDSVQNQIATFYAGAMAEARRIALAPVTERAGALDLVVIAPNDPEAMLRHTAECRELGIPFAADPSQQLARLDGESVRLLLDGPRFLFSNEYEAALLQERTGWSADQVLQRVGTWITTLGAKGVRIERAGEAPILVPAAPTTGATEPTGVGDAFRAGFLAGVSWDLTLRRSAELGCALATVVLESVGTQEYHLDRTDLLSRLRTGYGTESATELEPRLSYLARSL
ncbi:carbohydrate kinase family protein [Streptomyces sp. RKAG337]|uniref:carbohydrate kinase family protein n=1 Tax=Streptomyces sp. RKAG337 TaxID=2893404 RepID=UPI00203364B9|nr:carbohydrate kinase family protein [Streptomyces sp. RKAG337]MCM2426150.1 carbohydrate kinase family protein [Streptomyces sp. RKAG337]